MEGRWEDRREKTEVRRKKGSQEEDRRGASVSARAVGLRTVLHYPLRVVLVFSRGGRRTFVKHGVDVRPVTATEAEPELAVLEEKMEVGRRWKLGEDGRKMRSQKFGRKSEVGSWEKTEVR